MEIPRFEKQNVNPRLASADIGDAFQGFVHELLLLEHPALHRFPGGGKDGGIDLIETSDTCFVVECKVVGEDDKAQIEQRWKTVRDHLEEHLSDPKGPTKVQSQYTPWYSTGPPIAEYTFCVSAAFANEQQRRDFKTTITDYLHDLAKRRSHLSHLGAIKVSIIDWNDLCDRLRKRPHSFFRWFPGTRPNGFVPLDEALDVGTFRAYLNSAKLPYYSLSEHLSTAPPPNNASILNEESLLARFEDQTITGLVINGKGGIGKSRLILELGWKALGKGWTVMRVQSRLKNDALEKLAERLTPQTPALLLVDRSETVQWILAKAGILVTKRHVAVCHDLPMLAVFLSYLHTSGRTEQLAELLSETEFGRWVARRVQLTFPTKDVSRNLALLVPLFPMADAASASLQSAQLRPVFERLATDGWIEKAKSSASDSFDQWVTAHDVLADQILLSYLRSIPNTAEAFVAELFSLAANLNCLGSVISSLQRPSLRGYRSVKSKMI